MMPLGMMREAGKVKLELCYLGDFQGNTIFS